MSGKNLIQTLYDLQHEHGWLSDEVLRAYSATSSTPLYRLQEVASFYPHFHRTPPPKHIVQVCRDAACHLAKAACLRQDVAAGIADLDGVELEDVSCLGRCEHAPAAAIDDVPLLGWDAPAIIEAAQGTRPLPPDEPTDTPRSWPSDPYAEREAHYGTLRKLLADRDAAAQVVPQTLMDAKLRGMGGAGFPTGLKWRFVRDAAGPDKVAVVNADESEPGTFKDRVILEELPHLVVEGLLIGCLVTGATEAWIYIRHEYGREAKAIRREIARVQAEGLCKAVGVALDVFVSPGGYILGEETALIEALEGKRGEPRNKPPYPTTHGVRGLPTLMNNVETFSFVPAIVAEGAEAWCAHGAGEAAGWKFLSICGDVAMPGVACVPMGTSVRTLIEEHAGGMRSGVALKAFSPGGASAPFLPASAVDTALTFEAMEDAGSMLGSGAVLVVGEGRDMLDLATNVVRFFRNESCGKCVPCRVGSEKAVRMLEHVQAGTAKPNTLDELQVLDETLRLTSICGLGHVVLNPLTSVLKHFPDEVRARGDA